MKDAYIENSGFDMLLPKGKLMASVLAKKYKEVVL
jgi:hypothetical protein